MKGKINIYVLAAWVAGIVLLAVILPILWIGQYNYPTSDDFRYGFETVQVWRETHSLWQTVLQAFQVVKDAWWSWQGSFSAIFLMALQPDIFADGTNLYGITPYIMVGSLILSELVLGKVVLINYGKIDRCIAFALVAFILVNQILWVIDPVEAFFWYNGTIYYTFYYSLSLLFWAVVLSGMRNRGKKRGIFVVLSVLLGIFLGGGNLPTGLLTLELLLIALAVSLLKKEHVLAAILPPMTALIAAFAVNVLAPGNANRQAISVSMSAMDSIITSLKEGVGFIALRMNGLNIVMVLALMPFLWQCAKKVKISYRLPVVFTLLTFGLFASQMTPTLYAQSYTGPYRLLNIIYYSFWIWIEVNVFYWLGWCQRSFTGVSDMISKAVFEKKPMLKTVGLLAFWGILGVLYVVQLPAYGYTGTSTFGALLSLRNGEARQYAAEQEARLEILHDPSVMEVELIPLQATPYIIFLDDIGSNPYEERNQYMAWYYGKEKIWMKE